MGKLENITEETEPRGMKTTNKHETSSSTEKV